jgi:hypothetical protein
LSAWRSTSFIAWTKVLLSSVVNSTGVLTPEAVELRFPIWFYNSFISSTIVVLSLEGLGTLFLVIVLRVSLL